MQSVVAQIVDQVFHFEIAPAPSSILHIIKWKYTEPIFYEKMGRNFLEVCINLQLDLFKSVNMFG